MHPSRSVRARFAAAALATLAACPILIGRGAVSIEEPATSLTMARTLTIRVDDAPLWSVLKLIEGSTDLRFTAMWADTDHPEGLSQEMPVDLDVRGVAITQVIERILAQADQTIGGGMTWQLAADGSIQIGPRSRLNAYQRVQIYDVSDLLFVARDSRETATIDLQAALQASPGSGGSTSVLREPAELQQAAPPDPMQDLIGLLTETVEPEQWEQFGGAATIRPFQKGLIVRAPGYVHRQIQGEMRRW